MARQSAAGKGWLAMSLVENEQTKLLAAALNTAATSSVTVGILAPMAAAYYSLASTHVALNTVIVGGMVWLTGAIMLHMAARHVLRGLMPCPSYSGMRSSSCRSS
jgi:hypothetical protein